MAYYMQQLPQFPSPVSEGPSTTSEPWVNDDVVLRLTAMSQHTWREQLYHGEDFAGRDDCVSAQDAVTPATIAAPIIFSEPNTVIPIAENGPIHPSFVRRMLAMVCATAIAVSASALGLWAAHSTSPKSWPPASHSEVPSLLSHR